jgi:hypothetical protein
MWPSTETLPVVAPCTRSWDHQVNNYVDYVHLHDLDIVKWYLPETNITWPRSWDLSHTWHASAYVALRVYVSPTTVMIYFTKSC